MTTPRPFPAIRTPRRVRHGYRQAINATPDTVFPLLCPVREMDWLAGWRPHWVLSASGVAERHCVFQTPGDDGPDAPAAVWVVTRHDPRALQVEMVKVAPGHTVTCLEVSLAPRGSDGTWAEVNYEFTAIGPAGDRFLDACTPAWYREFMQRWETAMNHFLETGRALG